MLLANAATQGGGRGGRGGGGGGGRGAVAQAGAPTEGAPAASSAGAGGAGAAGDQDQNPTGPTAPENIQAKLGTTSEMLNVTFNPNPEQKKTIQAIPAELQKQGDRVKKVSGASLPALIKALKDAGIEVKTP